MFEQEATIKEMIEQNKAATQPSVSIDENQLLPYGFGFDNVIKERNEEQFANYYTSKKYINNKIMDKLVDKLGYLDYRDALAANKFILEAQRNGDYHV